MKKKLLIIGGVLAGLTLGGLVVAAIMVGTEDFGEKITYFQSAFEVDKPYFDSCPTDEELKKLFKEHKKDFHQLAIMAYEDKISQIRKNWIFHNDKYHGMVFYPYILGEFPPDTIVSRDRFFKYLDLMKKCKVQDIGADYEQEGKDSENDDTGKSITKGLRFFLFEDYKYDDVPEEKFLAVNKHIYYYEKDDKIKFIPDTDIIKESDKVSDTTRTAFAKLEEHWMIEKSIGIEFDDPSKDETNAEKSDSH
ncbi:MAG: hypothetical protein IPG59_20210 [Candidatus Melainabacteria bacterium]|nr:MAG: hypothetical protein IPG59_20210 [Candidatus Melainabacteria bacterium]